MRTQTRIDEKRFGRLRGVCFPSNETLARVTAKSDRSIRRMLSKLKVHGEIEILTSGTGRGQKRNIRLTRYLTVLNG